MYTKKDDFHKDIAEDVETRFDTSNYELLLKKKKIHCLKRKNEKRKKWKIVGLMKGKNKELIELMKDELVEISC